ncbi:MAG: thioredoxin family protein, partial [Caldimonas sp.]
MKPSPSIAVAVVVAVTLAACSKGGETRVEGGAKPLVAVTTPAAITVAAVPDHADTGIAWKQAASDADVDAAFAIARAETKPVFVYWGAKWCPPCNQVKATLFNRQDFIERSRAFV